MISQENKGDVRDDFRGIQEKSRKMSSEESELYHRKSKTVDEALRTRLSRVFKNEIISRSNSDRSIYESVIKND